MKLNSLSRGVRKLAWAGIGLSILACSSGDGGGTSSSGAGAGGAATGGRSSAGTGAGGSGAQSAGGTGAVAGAAGSGATAGVASGGTSGSAGAAGAGGTSGAGGVSGGGGTAGAGGTAGGGGISGGAGTGGAGGSAGSAGSSPTDCLSEGFVNDPGLGPEYDQFSPVLGSHCKGTNHQQIEGVERVVFLGDSVTVGTPPTGTPDFYRVKLASHLATKFGLGAPGLLWNNVNIIDGVGLQKFDGSFANCSKWGARTDDYLMGGGQITECFPVAERDKKTLVVMTMGGNDISSITQDGIDGVPIPDIWDKVRQFVQFQRDAVEWLKDPVNFPNGSYVVFANMFEFTDGTGDVTACPAAGLAGFGAPWDDPNELANMVIWATEQFMKIAVDTGSDMVFMLEKFCGHGFNHNDPSAPCYRGPSAENWFDLTCIHPNPTGHGALSDLFEATIDE